MGRTETVLGRGGASRHRRGLPRPRISRWLAPTGGGCCWPRPEPTPGRSTAHRLLSIPPTRPRRLNRPGPLPVPTHRRRWSLPVCVARAQDSRGRYAGPHRGLAPADLLHQRGGCGARRHAPQLAAQEGLHGLALECGASCEFVADGLWNVSYGNLYCHESIVPSLTALCKHITQRISIPRGGVGIFEPYSACLSRT